MKTLIKKAPNDLSFEQIEAFGEQTLFTYLKSNHFKVVFTKGLDIEHWRITSFTYDDTNDKFEFTMPVCVGENPDDIIQELSENKELIDFKICYLDNSGVVAFTKDFEGYLITSGTWTLVGNSSEPTPISVKFTLKWKNYPNFANKRWVL